MNYNSGKFGLLVLGNKVEDILMGMGAVLHVVGKTHIKYETIPAVHLLVGQYITMVIGYPYPCLCRIEDKNFYSYFKIGKLRGDIYSLRTPISLLLNFRARLEGESGGQLKLFVWLERNRILR